MQSLWLLIKQYQVVLLFIALEFISAWLIVTQNHYQNAVFLNSANRYIATLHSWMTSVEDYFRLTSINRDLVKENARLRQALSRQEQLVAYQGRNQPEDSLVINKYDYVVAKVVNNSTHKLNNYITINQGRRQGIEQGMGIISPLGIVGKVSASNDYFSTAVSLLHSDTRVSAQIKKNGELGYVQWEGKNPRIAKLKDVPDYIEVKKGDTIVTSGYNAVFPPKVTIGTVSKVSKKAQETFYDIEVILATNFNSLDYVYVVKNILKLEQDSLEIETFEEINE